ncbi:MAG: TRAP transporter fused permease subunit [Chloroflexi bacterium]|nr:TRAP transporter fused permease subunit [Chloroflexota bacterium]
MTSFGLSDTARKKMATVVAVSMSIYAVMYVGRIFDAMGMFIPQLAHRSLFLAFLLTLCFLFLPIKGSKPKNGLPWYDILIILIAIAGPIYNFFAWKGNAERYAYQDLYLFEIVFAFTTIIAVLEATRRSLGPAMPLIALLFLLHMFFGNLIPGVFQVHQVTIVAVANAFVYHDAGVYGVALGVAATVIVMFIIFSQFMFATGAGDFMIKMALSLFGHVRGGPAKVAVVASGFMGMLSGATTANIASTGVFTIPLMKKTGYTPEFAGAVETVASNGGQIMPPVMGLVAFVMAQWLGVKYWSIALVSFIPAFLYFIAVFIMVDSEAARVGLRGMPRSECPPIIQTVKDGWIFLIPLFLLVFLLGALQYTPESSVLYATMALILLSAIKWAAVVPRSTAVNLQGSTQAAVRTGMKGLRGGGEGMIIPGIACACAGIIIGALSITQIGIVLSDAAVALAGDNLLILLALAAFACFILGMGMSSLPAYILVVIVVAPALLKFGVPPLSSHLFIFWFAIVSFITPPVAIGAYVAAGIAGGSPMRTGLIAARLGFCTYALPFMFVYNPALILQGSPGDIILAVVISLIGVALISWGIGGYFLTRENLPQQLLLLAAGILFITMQTPTVIIGLILGTIVTTWQIRTLLQRRDALKQPPT